MNHPHVAPRRLGRKTHLAQALALALSLGAGGIATAQAQDNMTRPMPAVGAQAQAQAALAARTARRAHIASLQQAQPMATQTWYVSNCNDSGGGSLRYMVNQAASGDIIDLSTMSCNLITLSSGALLVPQDNLTLAGKRGPFGFLPGFFIHGAGSRIIDHTGTGTLALNFISVSDGHVNTSGIGGCILSSGSVKLNTSSVYDCIAERPPGSTSNVEGGGIHATDQVTLNGWSYVAHNKAIATAGNAYGGGIWAGGWVQVNDNSSVNENTVKSNSGNVYGGGIYGKDWVDVYGNGQVVGNIGEIVADYTRISGTGIYCERNSVLEGALIAENHNAYGSGGPFNIGRGVGIYAKEGLDVREGTVIRDNVAWASGGAGIFTHGYLDMWNSTVSGNYGGFDAAIYASGNVSIRGSTISGNRSRKGAAIKLGADATEEIMITRSTISGNRITSSSVNGAALALRHDASITHSTITGNVGKNDTDTKYGAGISLDDNVDLYLFNTIVSGNYLAESDGTSDNSNIGATSGNTTATIDAQSDYNLYGLGTLVPTGNHGVVSNNPLLGPLQFNGGPTKTHLPAQDSPVVNAGSDGSAVSDQRGEFRTSDGQTDIGSVEMTDMELYDRIFADGFQ